ncbi:Butyrophilin subfamily 3 member A2 [Acipenser ruthenus]|uniref:Butyrophilin subfamily 3 member A2 n=1 Tax=Acipenser ruthenus TaxID=7906 RepID=A0A444UXE5_ACIRT|nr:Butyrophilin subfamily 3 member A2 [Acipenser ruthenus]
MSSENSMPGESAQEAELQVEMKKTQVSQITHFAEDSREVPSSERTLDATPIIPNPQDQDKPQGPADTLPVTSTEPSPPGEIKIDSVGSNSVSLSWGSPAGMDEIPHSFKVTSSSSVKDNTLSITAPSNSTLISKLRPGIHYSFTVTTVLENGTQSTPVSAAVFTKPTPPGKIKIDSVGSDSVSLSWRSPPGLDEIPHSFKVTYLSSVEDNPLSITAPSNSTVLSNLIPGREYTFTVTTELENGIQSTPVSTCACTRTSEMPSEKSVPGERAQEAELQVEMKKTQVSQITHFAEDTREVPSTERTLDTTPIIPNPQDQDKPQGPADTSPATSTGQGIQSMPASRFLCTKPSPPGEIKIDSVGSNSVSLSWGSPAGMDEIPHSFKVTSSSSVKDNTLSITAPSNSTLISKLRPGIHYSFTVTTVLENGTQSTPVSAAVFTKPTPPGKIKIDSVGSDSVSLSWRSPPGLDEIPHSFKVTYLSSVEDNPLSITAPSNSTVLSDLIPGREYTFTVTTELVNGIQSTPVSTSVCTKTLQQDNDKLTQDYSLQVPKEPLVAHVEKSILLPCHLSPTISAEGLEVRWLKVGDDYPVHEYANGADLEGKQSPGYRGRTRLFKEELGTGNVSLQLSNVRVSDEGKYQCYVLSSEWFTESAVNLMVTGLGSSPRITLLGWQDSDVSLLCESEGWFPKPELHWRNVKDADLTGRAVLTEKQGTDGLFTLQSALQISQREADGIICLIRQGEEKRILQTRVHISGK